MKRQTTSIKVNPEVWKLAKHQAINADITLAEYIEKLIRGDING